jgi:hypothetical protein
MGTQAMFIASAYEQSTGVGDGTRCEESAVGHAMEVKFEGAAGRVLGVPRASSRVLLVPLLSLSALTACSRAPQDTPRTVDYYRAHSSERQTLLKLCANDPGSVRNTPACINAREAEGIEGIGSLRRLPPLGLPHGASSVPPAPSDSGRSAPSSTLRNENEPREEPR